MGRFFGTPDGVKVGQLFVDREDLRLSNMHGQSQAGISGSGPDGADAIVLSGGYADDADHGNEISYTGHGGQDPNRRQIADQDADARGNAALITSYVRGLPVRVIRGSKWKSPYSPPVGYRYAGLYLVTKYWHERGAHGFIVLKFWLERISEQEPLVTNVPAELNPTFASSLVSRRIRDSALAREVKAIYADCCQICQTAIPGVGERLYSEGAHVKPLGRPHLGKDSLDNLLCLCPNHHTQFDIGGFVILDDFSVARALNLEPFAQLKFKGHHAIQPANVSYHRRMWAPI
ncbi:MAG: HNH endonuclease [Candidatus Saccharibacteria bacterium]|nr:HNH endonuclease [Microbacteriaceae bacterium]